MAVGRAGKPLLGAFFVWLLILTAAYSYEASGEPSEENPELIPTPTPVEDNESLAPDSDDSDLAIEQYDECESAECEFNSCGTPLCRLRGRLWIRGDWLMWWTSGEHLPPLVTSGTADSLGILGNPGTVIEYGDSTINKSARSGARITIGGWLDYCRRWGLEADWLTLAGKSSNFSQTSDEAGNPVISRPYFDILRGTQFAYFVAYPDILTGTVNIRANDTFSSVGASLRYNLCCNSCDAYCAAEEDCCGGANCFRACESRYFRTDFLLGYRNYLLGDNIGINTDTQTITAESSTRYQVTDNFITRNEFHGGEVGFTSELRRGRWSMNLLGKMAIGNNHQTVTINGSTLITQNGQILLNSDNGYLALNSNKGIYPNDSFVIIPQFGAELGYQLTCRWRVYAGYNILFWASVMRAGDQIDLNIDTRNSSVPPEPALSYPTYPARTSDFWAQGLNVGTELRF